MNSRKNPLNVFILHALLIVYSSLATKNTSLALSNKHVIEKAIFSNYKSEKTPGEDLGQLVNVNVSLKILAINSVDVMNMEYTVDMYLRQFWYDSRLRWDDKPEIIDPPEMLSITHKESSLWIPDLFFRNGKKGYRYKMTIPNYLIRVSKYGRIMYSQKITMKYSCQMELNNFPMDKQICLMDIGSYGYTLEYLKFHWNLTNPVTAASDMEISEFITPTYYDAKDCTKNQSQSTGSYSCLKFEFLLERQIGSYLVGIYIPTILIVMVSWLSFWVSMEAVPARVSIGLLTLLSIITKGADVAGNLPRVSYIKAIDIWIISCILFVIASLVEFAVACQRMRKISYKNWEIEVRILVRQELARTMCPCPSPGLTSTGCYMLPPMNGKSPMRNSYKNDDFCDGTGFGIGHCHTFLYENSHSNKSVGFKVPLEVQCQDEYSQNKPKQEKSLKQTSKNTQSLAPKEHAKEQVIDQGTKMRKNKPVRSQSVKGFEKPKHLYNRNMSETRTKYKKDLEFKKTSQNMFSDNSLLLNEMTQNNFNQKKQIKVQKSNANEIDSYSRFIFPGIFLLYNCCYWTYYFKIA